MQFSEDLGFGVVDANVAVNLARAWTEQSTSANLLTPTDTEAAGFAIAAGATFASTLAVTQDIRIQHVDVTINDTALLAANTELILISPDGTRSELVNDAGLVGGADLTGGRDLSGSVITDNAFRGENSAGAWTLEVANTGGSTADVTNWSLTLWGDNAATVPTPLVYTPEFASLAPADPSRTLVTVTGSNGTTIDLIALPGTTSINLNGGVGMIDGIAVMVQAGLPNADADRSTGSVTLVGLSTGGSELMGGDGPTTITGYGHDTINGGLGATTINTGDGDSLVSLSSSAAASTQDSITSGGGDTIWASSGTVSVAVIGSTGDTAFAQASQLTFINVAGASTVFAGSGTVLIQAGAGGGVYYAGSGGDSLLAAGAGKVVFYDRASGDVLEAAGAVAPAGWM
ncbi:MAG TPA: proprotein convertase P-domain-containing protein [Acetobacteraceae bacterium]|jgi:subtilisin-like proprotein convertase family protein|nr:proprotein convertase P-domain-containing protein [Acetobacteraceae bacterium]